jgi:hypothetical protein
MPTANAYCKCLLEMRTGNVCCKCLLLVPAANVCCKYALQICAANTRCKCPLRIPAANVLSECLLHMPSIIEITISKAVMLGNFLTSGDVYDSRPLIGLSAFLSLNRSSREMGIRATPWLA